MILFIKRAQAPQPDELAQLQALLDPFTSIYNHQRPHRSLLHRVTPATACAAQPKAVPGERGTDAHDRVRRDKISKPACVLLLVQDRHIRIIDAATGELLRQLILDPSRDYQPTGQPPGPKRKTPRT